MPVVLYCPKGDGAAWFFEWMNNENVYDTKVNLKAAKNWFIAYHKCDRDFEDHRILVVNDPYEMRG